MAINLIRRLVTNIGNENDSRREEWVRRSLADISNGFTILDAGAGQQRYRPYCSHLNYVSQDFCQYMGNDNNAGLHSAEWNTKNIDLVSDITNIPIQDSSFEAILCTEVLEHVPDPIDAIREFYRLLKPNGILIVTVPFCSLTHMAPYHFFSGFNKYFFEHHLPKIGFDVLEISPNGDFNEFLAQEIRRIPSLYPKPSLMMSVSVGYLLRFLSKSKGRNLISNDLACFGFHVRARKS